MSYPAMEIAWYSESNRRCHKNHLHVPSWHRKPNSTGSKLSSARSRFTSATAACPCCCINSRSGRSSSSCAGYPRIFCHAGLRNFSLPSKPAMPSKTGAGSEASPRLPRMRPVRRDNKRVPFIVSPVRPDYLHHPEALCAPAHRRREFSPHTGHFSHKPGCRDSDSRLGRCGYRWTMTPINDSRAWTTFCTLTNIRRTISGLLRGEEDLAFATVLTEETMSKNLDS